MVIPYKQNLCVRSDGIGAIVSMLWLGGLLKHEPKRYDTCFNSMYVLVLFNDSFGLKYLLMNILIVMKLNIKYMQC